MTSTHQRTGGNINEVNATSLSDEHMNRIRGGEKTRGSTVTDPFGENEQIGSGLRSTGGAGHPIDTSKEPLRGPDQAQILQHGVFGSQAPSVPSSIGRNAVDEHRQKIDHYHATGRPEDIEASKAHTNTKATSSSYDSGDRGHSSGHHNDNFGGKAVDRSGIPMPMTGPGDMVMGNDDKIQRVVSPKANVPMVKDTNEETQPSREPTKSPDVEQLMNTVL